MTYAMNLDDVFWGLNRLNLNLNLNGLDILVLLLLVLDLQQLGSPCNVQCYTGLMFSFY